MHAWDDVPSDVASTLLYGTFSVSVKGSVVYSIQNISTS